jgi:hypothetical protein
MPQIKYPMPTGFLPETGFYQDVYVCIDAQWCISQSSYEVVSTQIFDLSEGLARVIFAGATAPAQLDDPGKQAL